jgi:hypothetical protein
LKYILLIYGPEHVWQSLSREQMEAIYAAHRAYGEELRQAGALLGGDELKPVATATTVRFSRGRPKTLDGPFAETKEQLAGYYLIDAENLDAAIRWGREDAGHERRRRGDTPARVTAACDPGPSRAERGHGRDGENSDRGEPRLLRCQHCRHRRGAVDDHLRLPVSLVSRSPVSLRRRPSGRSPPRAARHADRRQPGRARCAAVRLPAAPPAPPRAAPRCTDAEAK